LFINERYTSFSPFFEKLRKITLLLFLLDLQRYSNPPDLGLDKALKAMTALAIAMNNV
jgi:hypothetical protein